MSEIRIVDTTLRDGQLSLWAARMSADAMVPAIEDLDAAGFDGIEFFVASSQIRRLSRDLHEDPWEWLRRGAERATKTPLRLHGGIQAPFGSVPRAVVELLLDRISELGVRTTRASDPWNSPSGLAATIHGMQAHGIATIANIIYSVSPKHTAQYYAERTKAIAELRPYRLCFKDVGGLLTPDKAAEILPIVLEQAGDIPVEYHVHCNNGLGSYLALYAADLGYRIIHCAVPPLADGMSNPSVFGLVANLQRRNHSVNLDLEALHRVRRHFELVARLEALPRGGPQIYDESIYSHQVPGGMISNLRFQLEQIGMGDRLSEVLDEASKVRADLGYPIMVTPLAQFVGTQSLLNVVSGERYENVPDEIIGYALGRWGEEALPDMDASVRDKILDRPRSAQVKVAIERAEPSLADVRRLYGESISDEELIVRVYAGLDDGPLPWRADSIVMLSYQEYSARQPVRTLLSSLSRAGVSSFAVSLPHGLAMRGRGRCSSGTRNHGTGR